MGKRSTQLTMKDIARQMGTSVSTVSRALKDSPRISPERRAEIQAFAREHNFIPNALAGTLRHSKVEPQKTIGVVVPEIVHYYFASIISGIEEKASAEGFLVMVNQSCESYEREVTLCNNFYKYKVCGLIVVQAKDTKKYDHFTQYVENDVPIVFCDRICTGVDASRVVVDDYIGAYNAVSHLIETGCKRIAFFGSQQSLEIFKNRFNGWKDAMLRHGLKADSNLVYECDTMEEAERITPMILEGDDHPDAIFAVNDDTAIGALYATKQKRVQGARRHCHLRVYQQQPKHGLRPHADHRGAARPRHGHGGSRHTDKPGEGHAIERKGREARCPHPAHSERLNAVTAPGGGREPAAPCDRAPAYPGARCGPPPRAKADEGPYGQTTKPIT